MDKQEESSARSTRRDLLRYVSLATAGVASGGARQASPQASTMIGVPFEPKPLIRMGFVGLGGRGTFQMRNFAAVDGVEVVALCDIVKEKVVRAHGEFPFYDSFFRSGNFNAAPPAEIINAEFHQPDIPRFIPEDCRLGAERWYKTE